MNNSLLLMPVGYMRATVPPTDLVTETWYATYTVQQGISNSESDIFDMVKRFTCMCDVV